MRLFQAVDAHSGYDFPWSLHNIIPFWSGADHHDFHHQVSPSLSLFLTHAPCILLTLSLRNKQAFTNCFSTSFRYLDSIFGTDKKYHAFRAEQRAKKLAISRGEKVGATTTFKED